MKPDEKPAEKKPTVGQLTKEQVEHLKPLLKKRIPVDDGPGCFLCKWIYEDFEKNETLTDRSGGGFPATGKYQHFKLEGMIP